MMEMYFLKYYYGNILYRAVYLNTNDDLLIICDIANKSKCPIAILQYVCKQIGKLKQAY